MDEVSARARARQKWPVAKFRLGEQPDEDLSAATTALERLKMMDELAQTAWTLAGRSLPSYRRAEMPGRLIRRR